MSKFCLSEKRKKLREDVDYLFSKIDWGKSFLDAKAVTIMNEFMKDIIEADKEFVKRLRTEFFQNWREFPKALDKLAGPELCK